MSATTVAGSQRVLVLFGGRSAEHGVSCLSAANVVAALRAAGHVIMLVGITPGGRWTHVTEVPTAHGAAVPQVGEDGDTVALVPTRKGPQLVRFAESFAGESLGGVDVGFPVLHGPYGEDGTVQGMLATVGVPYVGSGVAASAVGIDKRQMKNVFTARGLAQTPYKTWRVEQYNADPCAVVAGCEERLNYPMFTKPNRQGSSIGISKCRTADELAQGIEEAFVHDRIAIVEQGLDDMRELECGVIGNSDIRVAGPGEALTPNEFYDFEGKYLDAEGLQLQCPAQVSADVVERCRTLASEAYMAIGARGMARVDFFYVEATGSILINEINTIPGFTSSSMFPHVWAIEGIDGPALVNELLGLALATVPVDGHYSP